MHSKSDQTPTPAKQDKDAQKDADRKAKTGPLYSDWAMI